MKVSKEEGDLKQNKSNSNFVIDGPREGNDMAREEDEVFTIGGGRRETHHGDQGFGNIKVKFPKFHCTSHPKDFF